MSAYVPDSTIKIYSIPHVNTNEGQTSSTLTAASAERYVVASNVKCQIIKKNLQVIKVSTPLATIQNCNYISFVNPSYGNKIYWGRIWSVDYINNKTTKITYTIDWWLTDKDLISFSPCEILREGLTKGEYENLKINPYMDYIKMRTGEPLDASSATEPNHYSTLGGELDNFTKSIGWDGYNLLRAAGHVLNPMTSLTPTKNFYVMSYVASAVSHSVVDIAAEVTSVIRTYADAPWQPPYLLVAPRTWGNPSGTSGRQMPYYGEARHREGGGISFSEYPVSDTNMARPYYMCGTDSLTVLQEIIDSCFAYLDETSSILSIFCIPLYLLDEFIESGFDHPDDEIVQAAGYVKIPFPSYVAEETGGVMKYDPEWSPKLFRFPYCYASLDGVNSSGHIELHYEKFGPYDPYPESGDAPGGFSPWAPNNVRVDEDGKPTYFVMKKFVSITADGVYAGVCPVDYDNRILNTGEYPHSTSYKCCADLKNGVFYVEFPQTPYISDSYYEFLGRQAKETIINNTEYDRFVESNKAADISRGKATTIVNAVVDGLNTLAGGITSVGSNASSRVANFQTSSSMLRETNSVGARNALGMGGLSTGLDLIKIGANAADKYRRLNEDESELQMMREIENGARSYLNNPQEYNSFNTNYLWTRAAFVTDNYHAGSCGGVLNMIKSVQPIGIYLTMRRRSYEFFRAFDQFFKNYGYATKEFGYPKIKYLLDDNMTADNAPHFETRKVGSSDDHTAHTDFVFYTQTDNLRVDGVCEESAKFIENMFNNGVLFVETYRPQ